MIYFVLAGLCVLTLFLITIFSLIFKRIELQEKLLLIFLERLKKILTVLGNKDNNGIDKSNRE